MAAQEPLNRARAGVRGGGSTSTGQQLLQHYIAGFTNLLHALQALQVSGDKLLACVVHSCILGLVPAAPSISASDGAGVGVGDGGGVSLLLLLLPLLRLDRWREGDLGRDLEDPEGDLLLLLLDPSPLWLLPEGRAGHLLIHGYRF